MAWCNHSFNVEMYKSCMIYLELHGKGREIGSWNETESDLKYLYLLFETLRFSNLFHSFVKCDKYGVHEPLLFFFLLSCFLQSLVRPTMDLEHTTNTEKKKRKKILLEKRRIWIMCGIFKKCFIKRSLAMICVRTLFTH